MPLHENLLALARELVSRNPGAAAEADLRRGVSTAYYALFHLLVYEATMRLVAVESIRPRIARAFDHRMMKAVCQEYAQVKPNAAGQLLFGATTVPQGLKNIAVAFLILQQARHQADYDTAAPVTQGQADSDVMRAEAAFLDWAAVHTEPAADIFLAELLCRGIPKR